MDIIFNCPKCEQELAVDSSGAGSEITCPSCGEKIVIPQAAAPAGYAGPPGAHDPAHPINPIASSAAAKVELHLKVPVRDTPTESLIEKPLKPLEVAAKEGDRKLKVGIDAAQAELMKAMIPLGRPGTTEEAAGAVYLFCLPESDFISGEIIVAAGGLRM